MPCQFAFPPLEPEPEPEPEPTPATRDDALEFEPTKEEEFTRATTLGLFDYLRKSASRGFVVSLSGGADSAAVRIPHLVDGRDRASPSSGATGMLEKLAHIPEARRPPAAPTAIGCRRLLTTVYQSTVQQLGDH